MAGKGSSPRPYSVDQKTFADNWDRIFKKEDQDDKSLDQELFGPVTKENEKQGKHNERH